MLEAKIINRGRGPEIEGSRITVFDVLDYLQEGWPAGEIARLFRLNIGQFDVAIRYIEEHKEKVMEDYQRILERCAVGNPPELSLLTVEGIYKDGKVELTERPDHVDEAARVLVTFLPPSGSVGNMTAVEGHDREMLRQQAFAHKTGNSPRRTSVPQARSFMTASTDDSPPRLGGYERLPYDLPRLSTPCRFMACRSGTCSSGQRPSKTTIGGLFQKTGAPTEVARGPRKTRRLHGSRASVS